MNDPNGLVFFEGEYHLFYQHNPFGETWGHMSWGHAVSPDLVRWQHLPVALREEDGIMVFSGSAVVDEQNTSGLCGGRAVPRRHLHRPQPRRAQTQNLAYSRDRGRTFTKYAGNPVLDLGREFRDPKVFWHEPTTRWLMVVVLPDEHKVRFFASRGPQDLGDAERLRPRGRDRRGVGVPRPLPAGRRGGAADDPVAARRGPEPRRHRGGLGRPVLRGHLRRHPVPERQRRLQTTLWADYGKDFYASLSFSDLPASDGRRIWMGWIEQLALRQ